MRGLTCKETTINCYMQVGAEIYSMKRQSSPCPNAANRFSNMPFLQKHCMFQWFSGNCGAISCDCNASGTLMVMRDGGGANCHWNPCPDAQFFFRTEAGMSVNTSWLCNSQTPRGQPKRVNESMQTEHHACNGKLWRYTTNRILL